MGELEESICLDGNGAKVKRDPIGTCDPYSLLNLFSRLPDEKKCIIRALGFAPLVDMPAHHLRGVVVRWMIEQYDTVEDKVNLNGSMLSITSRDVQDLLGFKDVGEEVEDFGCSEDIDGVRQRYGKMTKKELMKGILNTSIDGPDVLKFKCMVVLYVLQVYLSPTTHRTPKRFMLHIVKQTEKNSTLNWAKFLLLKLKSGIGNYKIGKKKIVEGCTHLLMVFYLENSGVAMVDGKKPRWESWTEEKVQAKVYQDLLFLQRRPSTLRVAMKDGESNFHRDVAEMRREIGEVKNLLNLVLIVVKEIRDGIIVDSDINERKHRMVSPCRVEEEENHGKGLTEYDGDTSSVGSMQENEAKVPERRNVVDESVVAELLKNIKHQFPKDVLTMRDAPIDGTWKAKKLRLSDTHKEGVVGVANVCGKAKVKGKRKRPCEEDRGFDDVEMEEEELRKAQEGKALGGEGIGTDNVAEDECAHATILAIAKMVSKQGFDANDMPTPYRAIEGLVKRCNFKSEEVNLFKYVFNSIGYPDSDILFCHPRMYEKVERQTFRRYFPNRWLASPAVDCNACLLNDEAKNEGDKWLYLPSLLSVKRKRTMRTRSIGAAKKGKKTAAPEDSTSSSSSSESSSSDSEEEPLTVEMVTSDAHFFRDEHHQRRYETYFKMRQPQKPHRFDMAYFKTIPIIFPSVFERTGWGPLLDCDQPTYTRLVRTMYASLQPLYSTDRASVHVQRSDALGYPMYTGFVCSRKFNISASMLDEKLGLGRGDDYHDFQTLLNNFPASEENMTKKFLFRSDYVIPEKRKDLNANFMKGEYRILHHCILRTICQRAGGYDYTGKPVLCLMNALLIKNIKVSAGSVMMYYIKKAMHEDIEKKGKKKKKIAFLPYGSYLLKYVREFGIELTRGGDEPMAFSLFNKHKITKMCYTLQSGVEGPDRWTRSVTGQAKAKGEASTSAQVHAYENDDSGARNLFLAPAFMQGTPAALDLPGKATKGWVGQSTSLLQRDVYRVFLEQQKQEQWLQYMTEVLWTTAARSGCKIPPPPTQLNIQIPENIKSSFAMNSSLSEPVDAVNSSGEPNPTPENEEETDN